MQDLNPQQREALFYTEGPLLVLAGAGSGKTRIIAHKFSYLVKSKRFHPDSIFTVTFTNKAANEMKERISTLIQEYTDNFRIGTFYSQCNKILRKEIKILGYNNDFSIYDEDDQHNVVRHILKEFKIHEALYKGITSRISFFKSSLIEPEEFLSSGNGFGFDEKLAKVYIRYQDELRRSNALDFDDLIMLTVKLFENYPRILEKYQNLNPYILVDEFQDTNYAQYHLLKLLAASYKRICVVGDDDQSIYKFRGADVNNILNFENDFPGAKLVKLEQNYRSTQNILTVSGAIISKNSGRKYKNLWTDKGWGEKVCYCWFDTYEEEAKFIAKTIKECYLKGKYNYKDFAIFYRVNLHSKAIEDAMREEVIPYRVFGNVSFYQSKEIKDMVAYMRLSLNHADNVSFRRIIDWPSRGIGAATLSRIEHEAKKKSISLFDAMKVIIRADSLASDAKDKLTEFIKLIESFSFTKYRTAAEMLRDVFERSGYTETLDDEKVRNVAELISFAEDKDIKDFLDKVSLFTHMDEIMEGDYISIMTLHSAKGLEFPCVFIIGIEEGVLPYCKALKSKEKIAEERRLLYVGMTRAKDLLWLTGASKRKLYSKLQDQEPSRFLKDIPKGCCQWIEKITPYQPIKLTTVKVKVKSERHFSIYDTGCRVKHPMWGIGVVRDCFGDGDDQKVTVNFPSIGLKRLAVKFANLEKIM